MIEQGHWRLTGMSKFVLKSPSPTNSHQNQPGRRPLPWPISHATTVNGRVDYSVGITTSSRKFPNRHFYSLLIAVEAKAKDNLDSAFSQIVVYLVCLHQARIGRGRT